MISGMSQMQFQVGMTGMPGMTDLSGLTGMPASMGSLSMNPQLGAMMQGMQLMAPASSGKSATASAEMPLDLANYLRGSAMSGQASEAPSQAAFYAQYLGGQAGSANSDLSAMISNYFGAKPLSAGTSMGADAGSYYGQFLGKNSAFSSADFSTMMANLASGKVLTEGTSLSDANYAKRMQAALEAMATASSGEIGEGTDWGRSVARTAEAHATGTGGWCLKYVAESLAKHGVSLHGASAYMAADQMAKSDKYREVSGVKSSQLKDLPAGAVVVWAQSPGHPHGHISISLGDGREASDVIRKQATAVGTGSFRVFVPKQ